MDKAKWCLGVEIKQIPEHITLNQDQYVKNTVSRIEKSVKHHFKIKDRPLPKNSYQAKWIVPQQSYRQKR